MNNSDHAEAVRLLEGAISAIKSGTPEAAMWRIADAGGLVARTLSPKQTEGLMGLTKATGRRCVIVQF